MPKKKITKMEDLAVLMEKGFKRQDKKINSAFKEQDKKINSAFKEQNKKFDSKIDNLALTMFKGFNEMATKAEMNKRFDAVESQIRDLREEVKLIRIEMKHIWNKLDEIERKLETVSGTSREDTDAIAGDVFDLRRRIEIMEEQIKEIKS